MESPQMHNAYAKNADYATGVTTIVATVDLVKFINFDWSELHLN